MYHDVNFKRGVKPADTIKEMRKQGIEISEEDAEKILDFLYVLAKLSVDQLLENLIETDK